MPDLAKLLQRWPQIGALLGEALEMLLAVADAHSCGVLQREIKLPSILVTADAQVRQIDFGIARLMHEGQSVGTSLTLEGGRAMLIECASPEQQRCEPLGAGSAGQRAHRRPGAPTATP